MNKADLTKKINAYERLMRLDKPVGILLLLWPTLWGLLIAGRGQPDLGVLLIFIVGTVLMRSAGCVVNDIADRNFDGHVARTKDRPLAASEVTVKEAYVLAAVLALVAFGLVCFLNQKTIYLSFLALFLAVSYPYTKRFIAIPQAYLGVAFGVGIPMAFAAINDYIPPIAWLLMVANMLWAIAYDTEYAMVDKEDDLKIGIKSSAIFFGKHAVLAVMICYGLMLALLAYLGVFMGYGKVYFIALGLALVLMLRQYGLIKKGFKADCFKAFLENTWIGLVILLGLLLELTFPL